MKLWRKTTRRSVVSAQNSAAPIVFASPRPIAPPMSAPSRSVTSASRRRVSTITMTTPNAIADRDVDRGDRAERLGKKGRVRDRQDEERTNNQKPGHV